MPLVGSLTKHEGTPTLLLQHEPIIVYSAHHIDIPALDEVRTRLEAATLSENTEEAAKYVVVDRDNGDKESKDEEIKKEERESEGASDETKPVK